MKNSSFRKNSFVFVISLLVLILLTDCGAIFNDADCYKELAESAGVVKTNEESKNGEEPKSDDTIESVDEIITLKVGATYSYNLSDFNRLSLSSTKNVVYEFTIEQNKMMSIIYKDSRYETSTGVAEPAWGTGTLKIYKSDGTLLYSDENNENAGLGNSNSVISFGGDCGGTYKIKFSNIKDGTAWIRIWELRTISSLRDSYVQPFEKCDIKYDSTGTKDGHVIFSSDETVNANLQTYYYESFGKSTPENADAVYTQLLSVEEGKTYSLHWLDSGTIERTAVKSYLGTDSSVFYTYTNGICCVYGKDGKLVLIDDYDEYSSFKAEYTGLYILMLQKANNSAPAGYVAVRVYEAPSVCELSFDNNLDDIDLPSNCSYIKLSGVYNEEKFNSLVTNFSKITNSFTFDMSEIKGLSEFKGKSYEGGSIFKSYTNLIKIILPETLETIGLYAFKDCESLLQVVMPDSLTEIIGYSFYKCSALQSINIPDSVTSIGSSAFAYCSSLTNVTLPKNISILKSWTFQDCSSLSFITIPNSVKKIEWNVFYNCGALKEITCDRYSAWYRCEKSDYAGGIKTSLTDSRKNATYFKDTYRKFYWYKS